MSKTLNLVDRLMARARLLHAIGRTQDAFPVLTKLSGFKNLSPCTSEEIHLRLAEIQIQRRRFRAARRHLLVCLVFHPTNARYHHLMATAIDRDPRGSAARAAAYYKRSLRLDPNQPACLSELALLALRHGKTALALKSLRRAVELAPDEPAYAEALAEALCLAELAAEARDVLRLARFQHPRDRRFGDAWDRFRFREEADAQAAARGGPPAVLKLHLPVEELPIRARHRLARHDGHARTGPHLPRVAWVRDSAP